MADEVFLTQLKNEEEPKYMKKVRDLNGQLRSAVTNLSDKVGTLLQEREKDFLAAYRHHMYNVQKELQEAKQKVREAELAMKNNDQIRRLKKERDWFRGEAIRLDNIAEGMRKDLEVMQEKVESIEDDRTWLEKQLKNSKKQIKVLRAELEASARAQSSWGGVADNGEDGSYVVASHSVSEVSNKRMFGLARNNQSLPQLSSRQDRTHVSDRADSSELGVEKERRYRLQIKHLRKQLQREKALSRDARTAATNFQSERGELEEFFLAAVEDVKRDVMKRRLRAVERHSKHNERLTTGESLPSLQDLKSTDRVSVIKKLLAHDEVINFLYDSLFPIVK